MVKTGSKPGTGSETQSFHAGMVVHGVGRVPDIEDLHLENVGVKTEKGVIAVDKPKVIIDEANDRIMGAHILGPNAVNAPVSAKSRHPSPPSDALFRKM